MVYGWSYTWRPIVSELVFVQSYVRGLWNHTWSLAVEEHFYLLLPLVLILVLRLNRGSATPFKPVLALAACVAVIALILRLLNWYYRPTYSNMTHLFASTSDSTRCSLALPSPMPTISIRPGSPGIALPLAAVADSRRRGLAGTPAFVFRLEKTPFIYTLGLTLFYLGSGMLLVGILLSKISPSSHLIVLMAMLGAYSYSIYLWHMPVLPVGGFP